MNLKLACMFTDDECLKKLKEIGLIEQNTVSSMYGVHIYSFTNFGILKLNEMIEKPKEPPRPLSKGDWIMWGDRLRLVVDPNDKKDKEYPVKTIELDGVYWWNTESVVADRIERLTEEHLKMLDTGDEKYKWFQRSVVGGMEYGVEVSKDNGAYYELIISKYSLSDAIKKMAKSVISRRRLDREMGV